MQKTSSRQLTLQFASTKTYTHAKGLSCCFRQPFAASHCRWLHGYPLQFSFEFRASRLDKNNWVVDFGDCHEIEDWLKKQYDHKTVIAENDPELMIFHELHRRDVCSLRIAPKVGMEAFAEEAFLWVEEFVQQQYNGRVILYSVAVNEHEANGAIVYNPQLAVNYIGQDTND